ncbi:hypothetical protein BSIN_1743 [Burkholderia singularis]|uniref:Uncharacterized protein n=1 Tax=Burkholderia singularis TaxID=1503053 RepID=A0A238GZN4_9BURK|nr:hypothetical protein BSIN_1743 [Burkholderia singularis]
MGCQASRLSGSEAVRRVIRQICRAGSDSGESGYWRRLRQAVARTAPFFALRSKCRTFARSGWTLARRLLKSACRIVLNP